MFRLIQKGEYVMKNIINSGDLVEVISQQHKGAIGRVFSITSKAQIYVEEIDKIIYIPTKNLVKIEEN